MITNEIKEQSVRVGNTRTCHDLTQDSVTLSLLKTLKMTSPSISKSAEKKTPEKKCSTSESTEHPPETAEDSRRVRFDLNAFAWMRIFTFANLLVRQG